MPAPEPLLKTQQVAEALGVSASTIKRWVDSGALPASRTVGKHRLVSLGEAVRLAKAQALPAARIRALLGLGSSVVSRVDDSVQDALMEALSQGRALEAGRVLTSAYSALGDGARLADELVRPVMERIGHEWSAGTLDVFQEHRATRIVEAALAGPIAEVARPLAANGPLAIGATPEGDLYTIPGLLAELALREIGWDVANLGPNLPLESLAKAVRSCRPRLIWLSIHHTGDPARFAREFVELRAEATAVGAAICLGGPGLDESLRGHLAGASVGDRLVDLVAYARRLVEDSNSKIATDIDPDMTDTQTGTDPRD